MKKLLLAAALAVAAAPHALAGDLPLQRQSSYAPPQAYNSLFNWTGFYAGVHGGYAWGSGAGGSPDGFVGGLQAGYNWQNGQFVFGAETDIQITGADDTFAPWKFSNPWFGTVRGRADYAFNNIYLYGTGGLAFGELRAETFGLSETHTNAGWTVGAGAEFGLVQNWTAKIEYLYVDLSNSNFSITGVSNGYRFGLVRAGVNYHF